MKEIIADAIAQQSRTPRKYVFDVNPLVRLHGHARGNLKLTTLGSERVEQLMLCSLFPYRNKQFWTLGLVYGVTTGRHGHNSLPLPPFMFSTALGYVLPNALNQNVIAQFVNQSERA